MFADLWSFCEIYIKNNFLQTGLGLQRGVFPYMRGVGVELREKLICLRKLVIHSRTIECTAQRAIGVG